MFKNKTKVKIGLFIDSDDPGGAETLVIQICRGLKYTKYEPVVLHFGNTWLREKCIEFNIPCKSLPCKFLYKKILTIPIFSIVFLVFLKLNNIQILHSHLFGSIIGASIATFIGNIKHVGTMHDIYTLTNDPRKIHFVQFAMALGVTIVVVSEEMRRFYESFRGIKKGEMVVIYNGTEISQTNRLNDDNLSEKLYSMKDKPIFICVGRLVEIKGHDILVEAFSLIPESIRPNLLIAGDGPCKNKILGLIAEKGLQNTIHLLGHRDDIFSLLSLCDCFILASHSEGLSCSIIEAMASGLPVIATNVGSNKELVQENVTGLLVPPSDALSLSKSICEIMNEDGILKQFGESSRRVAKERFSLDRMINEYTLLYKKILM